MPRRSPLTSVTCALAIATSVPVPIAIPTSARRERRRVVDAVARHGDATAFGLQTRHELDLVLRPHFAVHLVDAESLRDRLRGRPAVAGRHDDPQSPPRAEASIASGVVGLIGSATADEPRATSRRRRGTSRSRRSAQPLCGVAQRATSAPMSLHQRRVAERHRVAVDAAAHADAGRSIRSPLACCEREPATRALLRRSASASGCSLP